MKNSDKPIYPIFNEEGFLSNYDTVLDDEGKSLIGLTKREYFAGLAIQGLLSQHVTTKDERLDDVEPAYKSQFLCSLDSHDQEELCRDAISIADELLKQLETK